MRGGGLSFGIRGSTGTILFTLTDFVPVVGSIKAGISLITGTDPITGEAVSRWSSALNVGIAMIPGAAVASGVAKLTSHAALAAGMTGMTRFAAAEAGTLTKLAVKEAEGVAAKTIDPATVRFSQSSISRNFSAGGSVDDLATSLRSRATKPGDVPSIRLVERDGQLFTLDNRRLEAFRRAEVPIPYRMATPEEAAAEAWKFTTRNSGTSIRVRGE